MKTEKLYNAALFLLTAVAASAQCPHTSETVEPSFPAACATASPNNRPAYAYEANRRWAESRLSHKHLSRQISVAVERRLSDDDKLKITRHESQRLQTPLPVRSVAHRIPEPENALSDARGNLDTVVDVLDIYSVFDDDGKGESLANPKSLTSIAGLTAQPTDKFSVNGATRYRLSVMTAGAVIHEPTRTIYPNVSHTHFPTRKVLRSDLSENPHNGGL